MSGGNQADGGGVGGGVEQLIDLGTDITAPPPQQQQQQGGSEDIVAQLAQLGVTTGPPTASTTTTTTKPADEFDIFAESRTAYGTQQG